MSSTAAVTVIVEGQTEKRFVGDVLAPYLGAKSVFMTPIIASKSGQAGGDIRFRRILNDISRHLKQRQDAYVSLLVDYYGIDPKWPGIDAVPRGASPAQIANAINAATQAEVNRTLAGWGSPRRFIPYLSIHELEALLFSEPTILAKHLGISVADVEVIVRSCGSPEEIDNSPATAPSKRLETLHQRYKKTITGIHIAKAIGVDTMRACCPVFDAWLERLEALPVSP